MSLFLCLFIYFGAQECCCYKCFFPDHPRWNVSDPKFACLFCFCFCSGFGFCFCFCFVLFVCLFVCLFVVFLLYFFFLFLFFVFVVVVSFFILFCFVSCFLVLGFFSVDSRISKSLYLYIPVFSASINSKIAWNRKSLKKI